MWLFSSWWCLFFSLFIYDIIIIYILQLKFMYAHLRYIYTISIVIVIHDKRNVCTFVQSSIEAACVILHFFPRSPCILFYPTCALYLDIFLSSSEVLLFSRAFSFFRFIACLNMKIGKKQFANPFFSRIDSESRVTVTGFLFAIYTEITFGACFTLFFFCSRLYCIAF